MCAKLHELQCKRAEASQRLHELHRGTPEANRLLMLAFQEAAQAVQDHAEDCPDCKRERVTA
jgi:hypothetical protein